MPRRNNGRRKDTKTYKELRKAVKNFNAKVKRLQKSHPELAPNKLSYAKIKSDIRSAKELQTEVKEINEFNRRGGEKATIDFEGTQVSKWAYDRAMRKIAMINEQRLRQNQDVYNEYVPSTIRGGIEVKHKANESVKSYLEHHKQMKKLKDILPEYHEIGEESFKELTASVENRRRYENFEYYMVEKYKPSLIKTIKNEYSGKVPDAKVKELVKLIKGLTSKQLNDYYFSDIRASRSAVDMRWHYNEPAEDPEDKIDLAIAVLKGESVTY